MREIQEFIHGYTGGYNTKKCDGCSLSSHEISDYSNMGSPIDRESPCIEFAFDVERNNLIGVYRFKQEGTGFAQASYKHVAVLKRPTTEDVRSGEILSFFDIDFVSAEDVFELMSGKKPFPMGELRAAGSDQNGILAPELLVQIVCDALYSDLINDREPVTIVVPSEIEPAAAMRAAAKQILSTIPYGMGNKLSFSVNSQNCRIRFESSDKAAANAMKRYDLLSEPETVDSKLRPALINIIRKCAEVPEKREVVFEAFEKQFGGKFPEMIDYINFADAFALLDSKTADWEYFEKANRTLANIGEQLSPELKKRISVVIPDSDSLSDIILSKESSIVACNSMPELEASLQNYSGVLEQLASEGIKLNSAAAARILEPIALPKGYSALISERNAITAVGSMTAKYLPAETISNRCRSLDYAAEDAIEKYYNGFCSDLDRAVADGDVSRFGAACRDAAGKPFYDRDRCSNMIAYALRNPEKYKDKCEAFRNCAAEFAAPQDLRFIDDYADKLRKFNNTMQKMTSFRNYLTWARDSYSDPETAQEFLDLVYQNAKKNDYSGAGINDLITAAEQIFGEYGFRQQSAEFKRIEPILRHRKCRIVLNKEKSLPEVFEELLFCRHFGVSRICTFEQKKGSRTINVDDTIQVLSKVFDEECEDTLSESERELCAAFEQNCKLTSREKAVIGGKKSARSSSRSNSKPKTRPAGKRRTNRQKDNADLMTIILFGVGILVLIAAVVGIIIVLAKDKDPGASPEPQQTVSPSDGPMERDDPAASIEPVYTESPEAAPSSTPLLTDDPNAAEPTYTPENAEPETTQAPATSESADAGD